MFATSIIHPPHFPWCHVWIMNLRWVLTYDYNAFTDEKNLLRSQKKVIIHSSVGCQLGLFSFFALCHHTPELESIKDLTFLLNIHGAKCWINNSSKYLAFETNQQRLGKFLGNKAFWNTRSPWLTRTCFTQISLKRIIKKFTFLT